MIAVRAGVHMNRTHKSMTVGAGDAVTGFGNTAGGAAELGEGPGGRIAGKHGHGAAVLRSDVHIQIVGADEDAASAPNTTGLDTAAAGTVTAHTAGRSTQLRQHARAGIARKDCYRTAVASRNVDALGVGTDGDATQSDQAHTIGAGDAIAVFGNTAGRAAELGENACRAVA